MAAAAVDAAKYAETLRRELLEGLGLDDLEGSDDGADAAAADGGGPAGAAASGPYGNLGAAGGAAAGAGSLQGLDADLEALVGNDVIRDVLERGRVPREYAREIDDKLRGAELESIQDYIAESDALVALHAQMAQCDGILEHMEQLLGRFQSDLGKVSDEIRALQVQSHAMSTRLRNRRAIENKLGAFIEAVAVPEDLVAGIMEAEVNEDYLEHLLALDRRVKFVRADDTARGSRCRRDVEAVLEKLRIKAVTKVRQFLLDRLYQLRKPKTNISIIQQNVLLKYKYFVRFLRDHGADVHQELRAEYVTSVSRVLASHFKTYLSAMERMAAPVAGQGDVLGVPPDGTGPGGAMGQFGGSVAAAMSGAMGLFGKAQGRPTSEQTFELGERAAVLLQVDQSAVIPHIAEVEGKKFPYEVIFRNVHRLLADTASSEFLFCLDFWEDEPLFRELMAPIVAVVEGDLAVQLQEQWDAVGVLLMIIINAEHRRLMTRRRVSCLDDYLDRVNLLLWPRFKVLWDLQHASIKAGAEKSLFTGEVAVCPTVKRYAALTASVLRLMAHNEDDDGVFKASAFQEMLDRMWAAMFDLLLRMSNMFKDRRQGIVFLILNYNHIGAVWRAADRAAARSGGASGSGTGTGGGGGAGTSGGGEAVGTPQAGGGGGGGGLGLIGAAALKECEDQLSNCVALYVEDQLSKHFKDLVEFVKKAEQQQKRAAVPDGAPIPGYGPPESAPVLRDFGVRWKPAIAAMHREVEGQFADGAVMRDVLQASMTRLLLYYTRMLELLKRQGPEGTALAREAVNIPAIMYEIKAYRK